MKIIIFVAFVEINEEIKFVKAEEELGNPFLEKIIDPSSCLLSQGTKVKILSRYKYQNLRIKKKNGP